MPDQPGANLYTQGFGSRPENVEVPVYQNRAPTVADVQGEGGYFPIGKKWVHINTAVYELLGFTYSSGVRQANWAASAGAGSGIDTINSNAPVSNNYVLAGTANQITVTQTTGTSTFSIPSAFVAPGSVTATTTLTATLGNITATNGNLAAPTAGTGLLFNSTAATGAAASPVVLNARSGQVVFTSVSIAAAADLTLTITNSVITGASTQIIFSMSGATTGSALSVKSVTPGSGTVAFVVTNGTGATTTTADIKITFLVVN